MSPIPISHTTRSVPAFGVFVAMMASTMSLHAMAIDAMLPALPLIGQEFGVTEENRLQWIITLFVLGTGAGQLVYGPLSDRFGRRPILLSGLALYITLSLVASLAPNLHLLLVARLAQGAAVAAGSVVSRSIVRDIYSGPTMARVMSTIFIVFLLVPIIAPSVGQLLLTVVSWRGIFGFLALYAACVAAWIALRLPETLPPERRHPLSLAHLVTAARFVVSEPTSILYTLAMTAMFGSLLAFVSTLPQIFTGAFHAPQLMAGAFAACAGTMAVASFANSRLVERLGMHVISHTALICFLLITATHALIAFTGHDTLIIFTVMQSLTMACFGLAVSNFGAIAMQPMGSIAGSAASLQGVISTIGGASVASLIGHQWSGSLLFLPLGALCCGLIAFACVLAAERMQLFRNQFMHGDVHTRS
ncbi:MAG: multidrug effflux MFS transporter [Proteobacteria bacterium]|nr:multidrug effflux MFS transporter [Pseudomonadota bacterium]